MAPPHRSRSLAPRTTALKLLSLSLALGLLPAGMSAQATARSSERSRAAANLSPSAPDPDPRVGLRAGLYDAGEAAWNMKLLSSSKPSKEFEGETNSDLAFTGKYVI